MFYCDSDELKSKRICYECVGETYLSDEITQHGDVAQCAYCDANTQTYSIEEMADRIEAAFDDHYMRTSDQPTAWQLSLMSDRESDYIWLRDGEPVIDAIENAAEIPRKAANDIQIILDNRYADRHAAKVGEETEFGPETHYDERGASDNSWQEEWRSFEQSLKTEARFFSHIGAEHLASVFDEIDKLKTRDNRQPVLDAGPNTTLDHVYRARVFQSEDKITEALCRPDKHIGSPPALLASAGRMNARGISVFYGATEPGVAIAEVRPPVGSNVVVARFSIIRPLRLLDLTALEDVEDNGSIFDPTLRRRLERAAFLHSLAQRIRRPVMPDDEAFEYLATQAIADFLATENEPRLDGIIFHSAQSRDGRNVVLFHSSARVEELKLPQGTEIEARTGYDTEDGWEVEYSVTESVPTTTEAPPDKSENAWLSIPVVTGLSYDHDADFRDDTLRIDMASVEVHHIEWVIYQSAAFKVDRHRHVKHSAEF